MSATGARPIIQPSLLDPLAYSRTCRADGLPILGADAGERLARLLRYRALVGADEGAVSAAIHREYGVIGFELLTAPQADAVLAGLAALSAGEADDLLAATIAGAT